MTVNAVVAGSKLSVDLTMKSKGQVVDRATGAVLYSIDSIVSGHIDLDFCPDSGGRTTANVKLNSSEVYGSGGGSKGVSKEFSGNVGITVGDDANILKVEGTAQGSEDAKGVGPAGGGEAPDRHDPDRRRQHRERRERPATVRGCRGPSRSGARARQPISRPGSSGRCPCSSRRW